MGSAIQLWIDPENRPSPSIAAITVANLFGNFTWGESWKHGYEPLAILDVDGDGLLLGDELGDLWIWLDANSNAKLDDDEIRPAAEYPKRPLMQMPQTVSQIA